MGNIADQICDAVEILVNQSLTTAGFDKTVTAVIKSYINEDIGQYRVQTQDSIYTANAIDLDVQYKAGDSVYVLIPQGNFSSTGEKKILGYASTPSGRAYNAAFTEEDKYRIIGDNVLSNTESVNLGLVSYRRAKYAEKEIQVQGRKENNDNRYYPVGTAYSLLDYNDNPNVSVQVEDCNANYYYATHLKIEGRFRTALDADQRREGLYGLQVDIKYVEDADVTHYILSSDRMLGNPYDYTISSGVRQYGFIQLDKTKTLDPINPIQNILFWEQSFPEKQTKTLVGDKQIYYKRENGNDVYYYVENGTSHVISADDLANLQARTYETDIFLTDPRVFFCVRIPDDELNGYHLKTLAPRGNRFKTSDTGAITKQLKAILLFKNNLVTPRDSVEYYWGVNNVSIETDSKKYNKYLGTGWKCINEFTNDAWQPMYASAVDNYCTIEIAKQDMPSSQRRYKVVAVYGKETYAVDDLYMYNDSGLKFHIQASPASDTFTFDPGATVTLSCVFDGEQPTEGTPIYYWKMKNGDGQTSTLLGSGNSVQLPMSKVMGYADIFCTVTLKQSDDEIDLGTVDQRILKAVSDPNRIFITIDNDSQMFKYSTVGYKPDVTILPLTAHLVKANGEEVGYEAISKIEWYVPNGDYDEGEPEPHAQTLLQSVGEPTGYTSDKVWKIYGTTSEEQGGSTVYHHPFTLQFDIARNFDSNKREFKNIRFKAWIKDQNYPDEGRLLDTVETKFEFLKEGEEGTNGTDYSINITPWVADSSASVPNYPIIYVYNKPAANDIQQLYDALVSAQEDYQKALINETTLKYSQQVALLEQALNSHSYGEIDPSTHEAITNQKEIDELNWEAFNEAYFNLIKELNDQIEDYTVQYELLHTAYQAENFDIKTFLHYDNLNEVRWNIKLQEYYLNKVIQKIDYDILDPGYEELKDKLVIDMQTYLTSTKIALMEVQEQSVIETVEVASLKKIAEQTRNAEEQMAYADFYTNWVEGVDWKWNYEPYTRADNDDPIRFKVNVYKHSTGYMSENLYRAAETPPNTPLKVYLEWSIAQNHYCGTSSNAIVDETNLTIEERKVDDDKYWVYDCSFSPYGLNPSSQWKPDDFATRRESLSYANVVKVKATIDDDGIRTVLYDYLPVIVVDMTETNQDDYKIEVTADSLTMQFSDDGKRPSMSNQTMDVRIFDGDLDITENANVIYNWDHPQDVIKGEFYDITTDGFGHRKGWTACRYLDYTQIKKDSEIVSKSKIKLGAAADYDGVCQTNQLKLTITHNGNNIYCYLPVHLYLNRYGHSALNDWDGNSLDIDSDGGFILAPIVGAGKKESDNSYTGMLMGNISKWENMGTEVGLFGMAYGQRTFSLDAYTGKMVLGRAGRTRITIDPNETDSCIESANYQDGQGLKIGLSSGYIRSGGAGNTHSWHIESDGSFGFAHDKIKYDAETDIVELGKDVVITYNNSTSQKKTLGELQEVMTAVADAESADMKAEAIATANERTARILTGGGQTSIGSDWIITPYIGGGYLHLVDPDNATNYITLDPSGTTGDGNYLLLAKSNNNIILSLTAPGEDSTTHAPLESILTLNANLDMNNGYVDRHGWIKLWGNASNTAIKFYNAKPTLTTISDNQNNDYKKLRTIFDYDGLEFYTEYPNDSSYYYPGGATDKDKYRLGHIGMAYYRTGGSVSDPLRGASVDNQVDSGAKGWSISARAEGSMTRKIYYWQNAKLNSSVTYGTHTYLAGEPDPLQEKFTIQCPFEITRPDSSMNISTNFYVPVYFHDAVYNSSNTVQFTSDRRIKHDIQAVPENYNGLFDNLNPVIFKYNSQTNDKYHIGLIAQEVRAAAETAGVDITTLDLCGQYYEPTVGDDVYTLNYNELITLLIKEVQDLKKEVNELKKKS